MCRYCVEYGDGTKWYLNPRNYREELMKTPPHSEAVAALGGPDKNTFELSIASGADAAVPDVNYPDTVNLVLENMLNHAGQVVPIELQMRQRGAFVIQIDVPGWEKRHTTFARIPDVQAVTKGEPTQFGMCNVTKPGVPEPGTGFVPYIQAEKINYEDRDPWANRPDGLGAALSRISPDAYGNDSANWQSSTVGGTPGALNEGTR